MSLLTPLSLDYLAGFFDGEGSVTLTRRVARDTSFIALSVSNTHRDVISSFQQVLGVGSIHESKGINFPIFNWYASHRAAKLAGEKLLPFLTVKREELRLALEWYSKSYGIGKTARAYYRWDKNKYLLLKQEGYDLSEQYVNLIKESRTECRA